MKVIPESELNSLVGMYDNDCFWRCVAYVSSNILYETGGEIFHMGTTYTNPDGSVSYDYNYSYITINNVSDSFTNGNFYDMMCA